MSGSAARARDPHRDSTAQLRAEIAMSWDPVVTWYGETKTTTNRENVDSSLSPNAMNECCFVNAECSQWMLNAGNAEKCERKPKEKCPLPVIELNSRC